MPPTPRRTSGFVVTPPQTVPFKPLNVRTRKFLSNIPVVVSVFFAAFLIVQWSTEKFAEPIPTGPPWHGPPFLFPNDAIARLLGPYSPWYPVEYYVPPPSTCNITQAHILQRHGARFPTKHQGENIKRALGRIRLPPRGSNNTLSFMRKYNYDLKTDDLLYFGATEAFAAGVAAYNRYSHLAHVAVPFMRAGNSTRVVDTAKNWRSGFQTASRMRLEKPLLISEEPGTNNTLKDNQCPAHSDEISDAAQATWLSIFAPNITARLNAISPGSSLEDEDIPALMSLCSFESLSHYKTSPWCSVFEKEEFEAYEYYADLEKFYNTGAGNKFGRPQGIGWINELIARLTNSSVKDTTQTNHTLDSDARTFPLNVTMYADFTHDNLMNAVFAAMGILRTPSNATKIPNKQLSHLHYEENVPSNVDGSHAQQQPLGPESTSGQSTTAAQAAKEMDPTNPDPNRRWVASRLVPFAARYVVEKLSCGHDAVESVRVLLNDAVIHIPGCQETLGSGVCTLEEFIESQAYATSNGGDDWEQCQEVDE